MSTTLPAQRLPIVVNIGAPSSFYDQIDSGSGPFQWPNGTTIDFSVRVNSSRASLIDKAAGVALIPPDLSGNNVRYDWTPSDITTCGEGDFFAWWGFTLPGGPTRQETPEFSILLSDHGPGLGTQTGAIVDGAQMYLPVTFTALRKDSRFGDRSLQHLAELLKMKILGYTVTPDAEDQFPLVLLDFLSKRLALDLIQPGIDFWSRQVRTATATQTAEVTSFPDMIASLTKLRSALAYQLTNDWRDVQVLVPGTPNRKVVPMPSSSLMGIPHVTRNPQQTQVLMTGWIGWSFGSLGTFPFP